MRRGGRLVVDASVVVKWYFPEAGSAAALALLEADWALVAPDLLWSELANTFWKRARRGEVRGGEAERALQDALESPIETLPTREFIRGAHHLAVALSHPVYDCLYLALAEALNCTVITADARLAEAAGQHPHWRERVELLK